MASILVVYGTRTGQTATVARRIDEVISERGHDVVTRHVSNPPADPVDSFDAVVVGASVNYNRHQRPVVEFVEDHREALSSRPTAFFQLSFAAAVPSGRAGAREWADDLFDTTGWHPDRVGNFAGAVNYTQYSRPIRWFFALAAAVTTGDTDTSRDYEYTDWDEVERFAREFADLVETERSPAVPDRTVRRVALGLAGLGVVVGLYRAIGSRRRDPTERRPDPERGPPERTLEP